MNSIPSDCDNSEANEYADREVDEYGNFEVDDYSTSKDIYKVSSYKKTESKNEYDNANIYSSLKNAKVYPIKKENESEDQFENRLVEYYGSNVNEDGIIALYNHIKKDIIDCSKYIDYRKMSNILYSKNFVEKMLEHEDNKNQHGNMRRSQFYHDTYITIVNLMTQKKNIPSDPVLFKLRKKMLNYIADIMFSAGEYGSDVEWIRLL